jgi:hypothetical protein
VAIAGLAVDQVPPAVVVANVVVVPSHTASEPLNAAGWVFTVTVAELRHPVAGSVYLIMLLPIPAPVTTPVALTVATPKLELLQAPPGVAQLSTVVLPMQVNNVPVTASGIGFIVTSLVAIQPALLYVIILLPIATLVTIPVDEPIVATLVAVLVHMPPVTVLVSVLVEPIHTAATPPMADGCAFIMINFVLKQVGVCL